MTAAPLHLLAIGAHPDDIELTMGGLAIRFARGGHRVTWIVATDGAAGSGGRDPDLAARRRAEAEAAADAGGAALVWLGFPDGQLAWAADAPAMIGAAVAGLAPDLIVTHALNDYHADHRAVARIVGDTAPISTPVVRAETMLGLHFAPELLVDISDVFDAKLAALAKHKSQASLSLIDAVSIWNRFRGLQSSARRFVHAEAYAVDRRLSTEVRPLLDRIGGYLTL
jgi:LmbE family N-acetylglucosaminyl deacetylase